MFLHVFKCVLFSGSESDHKVIHILALINLNKSNTNHTIFTEKYERL